MGRIGWILPWILRGALIAGLYGVVHDQLTYSISAEYFSGFKFYQFSYLNVGLPTRLFVALVGFQAAWPLGALTGWVVASYGFRHRDRAAARQRIVRAFATVFGALLASLLIGATFGYVRTYVCQVEHFLGWEQYLRGRALQRFTVAGWIHNATYIGWLGGLVLARFYTMRQ